MKTLNKVLLVFLLVSIIDCAYIEKREWYEYHVEAAKLINNYRRQFNATNLIEMSPDGPTGLYFALWVTQMCHNVTFPNYYEEYYPPNFHDSYIIDKMTSFQPEVLIQKMIDAAGEYDFDTKTCISGDCRFTLLLTSQQVFQFGCQYDDCGDPGLYQVGCYFMDSPHMDNSHNNQSFYVHDPYEEGEPCTNCPSHHNSCYEGLCSDRVLCVETPYVDESWCGVDGYPEIYPMYDGKMCPCKFNNEYKHQCYDGYFCQAMPNECQHPSLQYYCPEWCEVCFNTEIPLNDTIKSLITASAGYATMDEYSPSQVERFVRKQVVWSNYLANFSKVLNQKCPTDLDTLEFYVPGYPEPMGIVYDVDSSNWTYNETTGVFQLNWAERMRLITASIHYGKNFSQDPNATHYLCQGLPYPDKQKCDVYSLFLNQNISEIGCTQYICANPTNESIKQSSFICLVNSQYASKVGAPIFEYYPNASLQDVTPPCPPGTVWKRYVCTNQTLKIPAKNGTCADFHANCYTWAQEGKCDAFPIDMGALCPGSCNLCLGDPDTDNYCDEHPSYNCGGVAFSMYLQTVCYDPKFLDFCPTTCTEPTPATCAPH